MDTTSQAMTHIERLRDKISRYVIAGWLIAVSLLLVALMAMSYQLDGNVSFNGIWHAQGSFVIWWFEFAMLAFIYWGYRFSAELNKTAELSIDEKTREFVSRSGDLESKLKYRSDHDNLTHLPNYHFMIQLVGQSIQKLGKQEHLAVIVIRINQFKEINYKLGSFGANGLLIQFAETLKTVLLEPCMLQPYMGMNMVGRLQGSEFVILIPRLRKEHNFESILNTILDKTSVDYTLDGKQIKISATIGAAISPIHGENEEILLHRASVSLQSAEKEGIPWAVYDPSMDNHLKTSRTLVKDVTQAIENDVVTLRYLPTVDLTTNQVIGAEVNIGLGELNPEFLPSHKLQSLIEGTGLERKLVRLVLKRVIMQLSEWDKKGLNLSIVVNVLDCTDQELPDYISSLFQQYQVSPTMLKISLTEKACLSNPTKSVAMLNKVSALGVTIMISDFLSGASSFVYLTNFPIKQVKIDNSFTSNLAHDDKKLAITQVVLAMSASLHFTVVADGIDSEDTAVQLKQLGCQYGQGPFFYKETTATELPQLINKGNQHAKL